MSSTHQLMEQMYSRPLTRVTPDAHCIGTLTDATGQVYDVWVDSTKNADGVIQNDGAWIYRGSSDPIWVDGRSLALEGPFTWRSELWALMCEAGVGKKEEEKEKVWMASTKAVKEWELIEAVLGEGRCTRVLLAGPPGTGKTRAGVKAGLLKDMEVFSLTMTDETPMAEVRGHFIAKGGDFHFHYGVLVQAWRMSHEHSVRVVLNEIDHTGADCASFLHAFLDDPELQEAGAGYALPNGERVKPGKHLLQVVATMNGEFEDLPEALLDRFPVRVKVGTTHPEAIAALPNPALRNAAQAAANQAEKSRVSIRAFKEFAALKDRIGIERAAQATFGTRSKELLDAIKLSA